MEQNLIYIIGFIILTFIALIVSFSLKYEKRDYGGEDHYGHEYNHEHTESIAIEDITKHITATTTGDDASLVKGAKDADTLEEVEISSSSLTLDYLNTRFSYLKAPDYSGSDFYPDEKFSILKLQKKDGTTNYTAASQPVSPQSVTYRNLSLGKEYATQIQTSNGTAYKIFVKENDGIGFVTPQLEGDTYEKINKIEYFGLTTGNNFPVPPYNDSFFHVGKDPSIKPQPQVLRSNSYQGDETTLQFGLFAKVGNPTTRSTTGLTGFTSSTQNYQIIQHFNFTPNSTLSINDTGYTKNITAGTPHYLIHIVDITDEKCPSKIIVTSQKQHVQNVVIISGKSNYGRKVDNILDRSSLTGLTLEQIDNTSYTKDKQYYYSYGEDNIYSIVFFKFNDTADDNRAYTLTVTKDDNKAPYVSYNNPDGTYTPNGFVHYVSYVNYYSSTYPSNTFRNDYENVYSWDGSTYTHKYWNKTNTAWENV